MTAWWLDAPDPAIFEGVLWALIGVVCFFIGRVVARRDRESESVDD